MNALGDVQSFCVSILRKRDRLCRREINELPFRRHLSRDLVEWCRLDDDAEDRFTDLFGE